MSHIETERIVSKPEVCGGKPCIAGTRIRVQDIYIWHEMQGVSADEIVSRFPHLSMADVYAALTYYWLYRDDIHRHMDEETEVFRQMKEKYPSPLKQKLAAKDTTAKDAREHPLL